MNDLEKAKQAVHVAGVIFEKTGTSSRRRRPFCLDDRSIGFPDGWEDEIVVGSLRKNRDGSITISCLINVYDGGGKVWGIDSKELRLHRKK